MSMKNLRKILSVFITATMVSAAVVIPVGAETLTNANGTVTYTLPQGINSYTGNSYQFKDYEYTDYQYVDNNELTAYITIGIYSKSDPGSIIEIAPGAEQQIIDMQNSDAEQNGFDIVDLKTRFETVNGIQFLILEYDTRDSEGVDHNIDYYMTGFSFGYESGDPTLPHYDDFYNMIKSISFTPSSAPAETSAPASGKNAADYHLLSSSFNTKSVVNGPTEDASFTTDMDTMLQAITTYHYNNGNGSTPGSISLLEDGVKVGEWQATGRDGNTFWDVFPDFVLKSGKEYTIVDSDNDTWSCNKDSYNMGFVEIRGYGMNNSNSTPASSSGTSSSSDEIKIYVNGSQVYPDSAPVIINDRTLVPIRAVAEALGFTVDWNGANRTVEVHNDMRSLFMYIGDNSMSQYIYDYNGNIASLDKVYADVPPQIINDRTYLPLRAVSEGIGATVDWDGNTRSVYITSGSVG